MNNGMRNHPETGGSVANLAVKLEDWTDVLRDLEPAAGARSPTEPAPSPFSRVIEEFRPLTGSLEWRVSQAYWRDMGVLPFAHREVPYTINNSGRLSDGAAALLFASCSEMPPAGRIEVVEFGAGSGLFARLFLDAFRALCVQHGKDFYQRLRLWVTDASPASIAHWRALGMFDAHAGHTEAVVADAAEGPPLEGPLRAAFCNYVLDVLPAANVRVGADGAPEQLCVRTHLVEDRELVAAHTRLTLDEIRAIATSPNEADLAALFPLLPLFEAEVAFRRDGAAQIPGVETALRGLPAGANARFNYGANQCLQRTAARLDAGGFILINDYGWTRPEDAHFTLERFGKTTALGINFPLLEDQLRGQGLQVRAPSGDDDRLLHCRLVSRQPLEQTAQTLESRFGQPAAAHLQEPIQQAREHLAAGRMRESVAAYRSAMSRSPRNWSLIIEAAEVVTHHARQYSVALLLCRAALELNPFFSAQAWRILGDALYGLRRMEQSHRAYLRAARIDPRDGLVNLGLARSFARLGDHAEALQVIARGLAASAAGPLQDRLLAGQRLVLDAIAARAGDGKARRGRRFSAAGATDQPEPAPRSQT
jgi:tetratricopeptide (TPR) repeat protein